MVTPHLGASTFEAQDKAGVQIAEQVQLALAGEFVPFAVNVNAAEASETVRPFQNLAESLGKFIASLNRSLPEELNIEYQGALAEDDTRILTLSVLKGLFGTGTNEPVSYVNAPQLAQDRGLTIKETTSTTAKDYVNLITISCGTHSVSGTLTGPKSEPRLVMIDDHKVEVPPADNMLIVRNDDTPGRIGVVTTILGDAGVSISSMAVGPSEEGNTALMVLTVNSQLSPQVLKDIEAAPGIIYAHLASC